MSLGSMNKVVSRFFQPRNVMKYKSNLPWINMQWPKCGCFKTKPQISDLTQIMCGTNSEKLSKLIFFVFFLSFLSFISAMNCNPMAPSSGKHLLHVIQGHLHIKLVGKHRSTVKFTDAYRFLWKTTHGEKTRKCFSIVTNWCLFAGSSHPS